MKKTYDGMVAGGCCAADCMADRMCKKRHQPSRPTRQPHQNSRQRRRLRLTTMKSSSQFGRHSGAMTIMKMSLKSWQQQATDAHIDGKNIRVEVACIPWSNYYETFMTAYQTGTGPDIACQASTAPSQYDELGATLDLSPIIEAWKTENPDFYNEIGEDAIAF